MLNHVVAILSGAIFVIAVIAGIGPQNLNIISHAIKKHYDTEVSITCFIADSILILAAGIGLSLANSHFLVLFINIIGILFIGWYLYYKIRLLFKPRAKLSITECDDTQSQAILRALALTWLNPLVFIDTIVVIGGNATHFYSIDRVDFLIGALLGDFIWIFGIAYIAKCFSSQLNRNIVWIILDVITIVIMSIVLYKTVKFVVN